MTIQARLRKGGLGKVCDLPNAAGKVSAIFHDSRLHFSCPSFHLRQQPQPLIYSHPLFTLRIAPATSPCCPTLTLRLLCLFHSCKCQGHSVCFTSRNPDSRFSPLENAFVTHLAHSVPLTLLGLLDFVSLFSQSTGTLLMSLACSPWSLTSVRSWVLCFLVFLPCQLSPLVSSQWMISCTNLLGSSSTLATPSLALYSAIPAVPCICS